MDTMNKTFFQKKEHKDQAWYLVDAEGLVLGRLATKIADILQGKNRPTYTPHTDPDAYVVVINAEKVFMSGDKLENKEYARYTGWMGGYRLTTAKDMLKKHPEQLIELAVKGMLRKNRLARQMLRKLKVYPGTEHPHKAQSPVKFEL